MCTHHWKIEEQNGTPNVQGVCKKCNATHSFRAGEPEASWKDEVADKAKIERIRRNSKTHVFSRGYTCLK